MSDAKTEMTVEREDGSRYVLHFARREDCLIVMERLQAAGKLKLLKSRVAALLKRVEWTGFCSDEVGSWVGCPICTKGRVTRNHRDDCELAALLKECAS